MIENSWQHERLLLPHQPPRNQAVCGSKGVISSLTFLLTTFAARWHKVQPTAIGHTPLDFLRSATRDAPKKNASPQLGRHCEAPKCKNQPRHVERGVPPVSPYPVPNPQVLWSEFVMTTSRPIWKGLNGRHDIPRGYMFWSEELSVSTVGRSTCHHQNLPVCPQNSHDVLLL